MTESGDAEATPAEPDDPLDSFKSDPEAADTTSVNDAPGGRPRLNWSPVTDAGGGRTTTERPEAGSGFHFDLGGALARLGGQDDPPQDRVEPPAPAPVVRADPVEVAPPEPAPEVAEPDVVPLEVAPPDAASVAPLEVAPLEVAPLEVRTPRPVPSEPTMPVRLADIDVTTVEVRDEPPVPVEPLPRRGERPAAAPAATEAVIEHEQLPNSLGSARRSVFDDSAAPAEIVARPAPSEPSPIVPTIAAAAATAPTLPPADLPLLPTLPPPKPMAAPVYTPPIESAPSTPDINALRSAQLRASKQQRQGKLFGRTLLVLLAIGVIVAGALMFGRSYLFPTEWDAALTPVVNDVQAERGDEFEHPVPLVEQPAADYALTIGRLVVDDSWLDSVPVWRALGLTSGEPTADGIAPSIAARRLAVYDPDADRIYSLAGADPAAAAADLRLALERAFDAQHGDEPVVDADVPVGFVGVSSPAVIADSAAESFFAERATADQSAEASAPVAAEGQALLPIPIDYELTAVDHLGEALLSSAGVDPASVSFGSTLPADLAASLDDDAKTTASGVLQVGDRSLESPIALGVDDWSLVWGARLPEPTVDRLVQTVVADSYRPIDRAGVICVVAAFETGSSADTAALLGAMQTWTSSSPVEAQAVVTQLSATRVQLVSCDPGPQASVAPQPGAADALVNRQLLRLGL